MLESTQKWLDLLRSGEMPQAQHALKTDEGFCCLGVGCELYRRETGEGEWVFVPAAEGYDVDSGEVILDFPAEHGSPIDHYAFRLRGQEAMATVLPDTVRKWLGLRAESGRPEGYTLLTLAVANDLGDGFGQIAGYVLEHPDAYLEQT